MKHRDFLWLALMVCAAAQAAEPAKVATTVNPAAAPAAVRAYVKPVPAGVAPATKPLDLRIGDIRRYMMPNEFREAIAAPDADQNTVVVQGNRELLPMKFERPVPGGIIAPFWALAHPLQSWRIIAPDLSARAAEKPDVVPPPIFRWGP